MGRKPLDFRGYARHLPLGARGAQRLAVGYARMRRDGHPPVRLSPRQLQEERHARQVSRLSRFQNDCGTEGDPPERPDRPSVQVTPRGLRLHTSTHSTGNPTIDACFDADRLDLGRVNITPDPEKMATEKGKELARQICYRPPLF